MKEDLTSLGLRLRHARRARKKSQSELATAASLKQPSISELETGETKEISGPTLIAICHALNIRPEWLVTGRGEMEKDVQTQHGMQLEPDEAAAVRSLRAGNPAWRRYVLSLAMAEPARQRALLTTMREAVADYKVDTPATPPRKRRPLFSTADRNNLQPSDARQKKRGG